VFEIVIHSLHKPYCVSIKITDWLILFGDLISVYSDNNTKTINTWGKAVIHAWHCTKCVSLYQKSECEKNLPLWHPFTLRNITNATEFYLDDTELNTSLFLLIIFSYQIPFSNVLLRFKFLFL